jgi:hypothetical protein
MPGFAGLAGPATALWRAAFSGQTIGWRARLGNTVAAGYGLAATGADPHSTAGVARCPTCYNLALQRSASSLCPTCYGVGWTGGFAPIQTLSGLVTTGTYQFTAQPGGDLLAVSGVWLRLAPTDALILPQDLISVTTDDATARYLVGELSQFLGIGGQTYGRLLQLEALAPDSPWQAAPL